MNFTKKNSSLCSYCTLSDHELQDGFFLSFCTADGVQSSAVN